MIGARGELGAGARLGSYAIVTTIRSGGMATLYLARSVDEPKQPLVALKVAHPHLTKDAELMRLFRNEARVQGLIDHPNVVDLHGAASVDGVHYLVMEYVHGLTAGELVKALRRAGRRLEPALALWLVAQVAMGLHAAHRVCDVDGRPLRVVHRDVSPHNILLSFEGAVKLGDFGVAKADDIHTRGTLKGKFAYMAPEQARGEPLDRRADVFALGAVAWELIAGERRFAGRNEFEVLHEVSQALPRSLAELVPDIPPAIDEALARATCRERRRRFSSARAMQTALLAACPAALRCRPRHLATLLEELSEWFDHEVPTLPAPDEDQTAIVKKRRTASGERRRQTPQEPRGRAVRRATRQTGPAPSLVPLLAEAARRAAPLDEARQSELANRLATLAVLGPRLTPDIFDDADAVLAYRLNAFVTLALLQVSRDDEPLHGRLAQRYPIDGEPTSLLDFDRSLGVQRALHIYAAVHGALRGSAPDHAFVADGLHAGLEEALTALVDDSTWLHIDHVAGELHLPVSAWPYRTRLAALARVGQPRSVAGGLAELARGDRRLALKRACTEGYRLLFGATRSGGKPTR